jgi:hypothetical protein
MILSFLAVLGLRTLLVVDVPISLLRVNYWSLRLWNYVGSVAVGLAWLIFAIATEGYFRDATEETLPVMLKRAAQVLSAEVVFMGFVYGVRLLI